MNTTLADQIRNKRKKLGVTVQLLADKIGVRKDNVYKWQTGTQPSDDDDKRILKDFLAGKYDEEILEAKELASQQVHEDAAAFRKADRSTAMDARTLSILEMMVLNTRTLVESNKLLVETNAKQTNMLDTTTAHVRQGIPLTALAKFDDLLESIADAASGRWRSKQEAIAELSSLFLNPNKSDGNPAGKGTSGN